MEYIKINYEDKEYPQKLLKIESFPKELYVIGNIKLLNKEPKVGIVGSRHCTQYGRHYGTSFAEELSKNGICIVSGMAVGIDTSAHIGAKNYKGRTIAVLGCGFNKIFPKENEWLFYNILKNKGCIITEYAPDIEADKEKFPARNRIVSGLSDALLVVEAEYRSGTSITAAYAKEQGKIICCLPSNLDSKCGIGTNKLIQNGAELVTTPSEIISLIKQDKNIEQASNKKNNKKTTKKTQKESQIDNTPKKEIPLEYQSIYNIIKGRQLHINEICKLSNKNITEVTGILTMLELEELAQQLPGNIFKVRED